MNPTQPELACGDLDCNSTGEHVGPANQRKAARLADPGFDLHCGGHGEEQIANREERGTEGKRGELPSQASCVSLNLRAEKIDVEVGQLPDAINDAGDKVTDGFGFVIHGVASLGMAAGGAGRVRHGSVQAAGQPNKAPGIRSL